MKILVVVDMQNDFITGALGTKEAQAIVPKVTARIQKAREDDEKIVFTKDVHFLDSYSNSVEGRHLPIPHCIALSEGGEIHPDIKKVMTKSDAFINKETFGSYELPELVASFDKDKDHITEITLIGLCTDICVISNAIILKSFFDAPDLPVEINVDASCCAGVSPESHKHALEAMKVLHINVLNEEDQYV